nr:MAG TPA: hypothetical protein [Caudoviricetes sp.]
MFCDNIITLISLLVNTFLQYFFRFFYQNVVDKQHHI